MSPVPVVHCASIQDYDMGLAIAVMVLCAICGVMGFAAGWGWARGRRQA